MGTQLIEHPSTTDTDQSWLSHIILEGWNIPSEEGEAEFVSTDNSVVDGFVFGAKVRALCGFEWVPTKDPQRYPVCPLCVTIAKEHGWAVPGT